MNQTMKTCYNCRFCDTKCNDCKSELLEYWQPSYTILKFQNTELIHLLKEIKGSYHGLFCSYNECEGTCKKINEVLGGLRDENLSR